MSNISLNNITLVSTDYPAPYQGVSSSEDFNDFQSGVLLDLISLSGFLNTILIPLLSILPTTAQAGLQGSSIYGDTADQTNLFYDSVNQTSLTIADSIRQLSTLLGGQTQTINNLSALVGQLQQQLSASNQYDVSVALNSITSTIAQLTAEQIAQGEAITVLQGQITGAVPSYQVPSMMAEIPAGSVPGSAFTFTFAPASGQLVALYDNNVFVEPAYYIVAGTSLTYTCTTGHSLYAVYFHN
jgi:hypothetical protein